MTPTHATKRAKRYCYYVSAPLLAGEGLRVSAGDIEALVLDRLRALLSSRTDVTSKRGQPSGQELVRESKIPCNPYALPMHERDAFFRFRSRWRSKGKREEREAGDEQPVKRSRRSILMGPAAATEQKPAA